MSDINNEDLDPNEEQLNNDEPEQPDTNDTDDTEPTSDINNTEQLRVWFRTCPAIQQSNRFRVDYVSERPTEYAIYAVPSTLRYHENILGEEVPDDIQVQNFIFASKEHYSSDIKQNLANLGFHQAVVKWILEQNRLRNFPTWDDGTIRSIVPTLTGYPAQIGASAAKYQIQLKITYRRN